MQTKNFRGLSPPPAVAASELFVAEAKPEERVPYVAGGSGWRTEAGVRYGSSRRHRSGCRPWGSADVARRPGARRGAKDD